MNKKYVHVGIMVSRDSKGKSIESTKKNLYIEADENEIDQEGMSVEEKVLLTDFAGLIVRRFSDDIRKIANEMNKEKDK